MRGWDYDLSRRLMAEPHSPPPPYTNFLGEVLRVSGEATLDQVVSCPVTSQTQYFQKLVQCPFLSLGIGPAACPLPGSRITVVLNTPLT